MLTLVRASFALPDGKSAPKSIVFVPEGRNIITPLSQPDGVEFYVPAERGEEIAAELDRQLQEMRQRNVIPWYDFEHTRKAPASGYPTRFWYQAGEGVMVDVDWSGSGRAAIENRDVRYFSPEVYVTQEGVPTELPTRGPLGGLVAEPAFRTMRPVAAADAGKNKVKDEPHQYINMSLILVTCGLLSQTEANLPNAESLAAQRVTAMREELTRVQASLVTVEKERDDLKKKADESENAVKQEREKRASDLVTAAVADGRIAAQDDKTKGFFTRLITAGDADAEGALKSLPKRNEGLDQALITAGQGNKPAGQQGEHAFVVEARRLVTAGEAKSLDHAFALAAEQKPALYDAYTGQFETV